MTVFIQYLVNGLSMGSVYAIIALGYTMVYGIAKMLNFAHGDVIMVGAIRFVLRHIVSGTARLAFGGPLRRRMHRAGRARRGPGVSTAASRRSACGP